jgi:hypothetical protein
LQIPCHREQIYAVRFVPCLVSVIACSRPAAARGRRQQFHLISEPHVTLDHLPRHPNVIGDLVDVVAYRAAAPTKKSNTFTVAAAQSS